ncbi:unnamed protein product, partial [Gulo gulo]
SLSRCYPPSGAAGEAGGGSGSSELDPAHSIGEPGTKNIFTCLCRDRAQPRASQRSYNQEGTLIGTSPQLQSTRWVL